MNTRQLQLGIFLSALVSFQAFAATHYVNASNDSPALPYTSWATAATNIQDALNFTANGDIILVTNGIYQYGGATDGGSSNRVCNLSSPVTIQSVNGPAVTIIKGYQVPGTTNGVNAVRCVYLNTGSTLSGFTLTNGATESGGDGGGVYAAAGCTISNCVITGNVAAYEGGGIFSINGSTNVNCIIAGNCAFNSGGGAYGEDLNSLILNNCVVTNNYAPSGGGLVFGVANNCLLVGNGSQQHRRHQRRRG